MYSLYFPFPVLLWFSKNRFFLKKYPEIFCCFGYYQYLCTRFPKNGRPPGLLGSVWEGVLWKISIRQRSSTRSGSPCLMHGDPGIWEQPSGGIFNAALLMFWCPLPSIDCTGYASLWQTDFFASGLSAVRAYNDILQWRVWSWLRMNASYRLNTCKSRGSMKEACFLWWRPAHGWVTRIQPSP